VLVNLSAARRCSLSDLSQLKSFYRAAKLIVIDGEGSTDAAVAAIKAGAWDYLHRPISSDELSEKIAQAQTTAEAWVQRNADPVVVYIGRHATAISCRAEVANRFGLSLDTVSSCVRAGRLYYSTAFFARFPQAYGSIPGPISIARASRQRAWQKTIRSRNQIQFLFSDTVFPLCNRQIIRTFTTAESTPPV
jgi:hypothetical protein